MALNAGALPPRSDPRIPIGAVMFAIFSFRRRSEVIASPAAPTVTLLTVIEVTPVIAPEVAVIVPSVTLPAVTEPVK